MSSTLSSATLCLAPALARASTDSARADAAPGTEIAPTFPRQDPELVKEMVTVAHFNLARVKELVGRHRTLAKAAWDWGFGDWESALGAASHVGNREIAEVLLANGARPTIFSAAMLGQLDVVKAFIAASQGVQRIKGPHSITLLRHAIAGGAAAMPVVEYLNAVGGADERPTEQPLSAGDLEKLKGTYAFGAGPADRIEITVVKDQLMFARGLPARGLAHLGSFEFYPAGAEHVRIRFDTSSTGTTLAVYDPDVVLAARKMS